MRLMQLNPHAYLWQMGSFALHTGRAETECLPKLIYQGQTPLQHMNTITSLMHFYGSLMPNTFHSISMATPTFQGNPNNFEASQQPLWYAGQFNRQIHSKLLNTCLRMALYGLC